MTSPGEIDRLHNDLKTRLRESVQLNISIETTIQNWERVAAGTTIAFDAFSRDYSTTAERKRGGRCPVFPLKQQPNSLDDQVWVGWHEEWHCERRNVFDLIGVGWTFFWGIDGRLGRDQEILRAEWDHTKHRGGFAAQPHWHLDTGLMTGYFSRESFAQTTIEPATELQELSPAAPMSLEEIGRPSGLQGIQELDLSGMHLGMGGWENHDDHPGCWQVPAPSDSRELVLWAVRTLQSATDQFKELRVNRPFP